MVTLKPALIYMKLDLQLLEKKRTFKLLDLQLPLKEGSVCKIFKWHPGVGQALCSVCPKDFPGAVEVFNITSLIKEMHRGAITQDLDWQTGER
ncbi:hypothetical protein AMELA_G00278850 [Ameiurus melas]|uniref:Uncharacterized protein n=1 Tax=Ameiurus melas TaxID=219545 RepID=A0A7J5ZLV3_AMEME|nr:hypothetical protein AMELA_G00278850 [Ameiurus melas]